MIDLVWVLVGFDMGVCGIHPNPGPNGTKILPVLTGLTWLVFPDSCKP